MENHERNAPHYKSNMGNEVSNFIQKTDCFVYPMEGYLSSFYLYLSFYFLFVEIAFRRLNDIDLGSRSRKSGRKAFSSHNKC